MAPLGPFFAVGATTISARRINYYRTAQEDGRMRVDIHFEGDSLALVGEDAQAFVGLIHQYARVIPSDPPDFAAGGEDDPACASPSGEPEASDPASRTAGLRLS